MGNGTNDGAVRVSVSVGTVERKEKYPGPYQVTLGSRTEKFETRGLEMTEDLSVHIPDRFFDTESTQLTATADKVFEGYTAVGSGGGFITGNYKAPANPVAQMRSGVDITIDEACGAFASTNELVGIAYDDLSSPKTVDTGKIFPGSRVVSVDVRIPSCDAYIFGLFANLERFASETAATIQYNVSTTTRPNLKPKTIILPECNTVTDSFYLNYIFCMRLGKLEHITNSSFYQGRYSFSDKTVDGKDLCSVLDIGCADYSGNGGGTLTVDYGASFPTGMDIIVYRYAKEPIIGTGGTGSLEDAVKSGAELYVPNGRYTYFAYEKYPAARSRIHMLSDYDMNIRKQYGY